MQPDPANEASDPVTPPDLAKHSPRGRGLLRATSAAGLIGCAVLGFLLFQAAEREKALQVELSMCQYQLSAEQVTRRRVEAECEELSLEMRQAELARDSATRSLTSVRTALSESEGLHAECQDSLESAVRIARSHLDKLDEIASAIRIGMIGVADIPGEGFVFSGGYDLESEYRKVVKKYNDLVDRFNAALERSNDLGEIVNRIVNILRS